MSVEIGYAIAVGLGILILLAAYEGRPPRT